MDASKQTSVSTATPATARSRFGARSFAGLVVILDEVETLQRVRSDVREKSLNSLRQLLDEVDAGRFPGLYILITGTPAFFDGQQGVQRLAPLAQRLETGRGHRVAGG